MVKRQSTKEVLAASLRELAKRKSIQKITVREIAANCEYSAATFYRHFHDKFALIEWDYDRRVEKLVASNIVDDLSWNQALRRGAEFYAREQDYLRNLLLHTGTSSEVLCHMIETSFTSTLQYITGRGGEMSERDRMSLRSYATGGSVTSAEWILGRLSATTAEIAQMYIDTLPPALRAICS